MSAVIDHKELRSQVGKLRGELKDADEYIENLEAEIADLRCSYKEALRMLSKNREKLDFYTLDILTMFLNERRDEFHEFAQEFDDYPRKETDKMLEVITSKLIPAMYDQP